MNPCGWKMPLQHVNPPVGLSTSVVWRVRLLFHNWRNCSVGTAHLPTESSGSIRSKANVWWWSVVSPLSLSRLWSSFSHQYASLEEAQNAREGLDGCRWPSTNPKTLVVRFGRQEEVSNDWSSSRSSPSPSSSSSSSISVRITIYLRIKWPMVISFYSLLPADGNLAFYFRDKRFDQQSHGSGKIADEQQNCDHLASIEQPSGWVVEDEQ